MEYMHVCYVCKLVEKESAMSSYAMPDGEIVWYCNTDVCNEGFATGVIGG